jgi:uncharacterized membrane protein
MILALLSAQACGVSPVLEAIPKIITYRTTHFLTTLLEVSIFIETLLCGYYSLSKTSCIEL